MKYGSIYKWISNEWIYIRTCRFFYILNFNKIRINLEWQNFIWGGWNIKYVNINSQTDFADTNFYHYTFLFWINLAETQTFQAILHVFNTEIWTPNYTVTATCYYFIARTPEIQFK
jgi:hypothetical protein